MTTTAAWLDAQVGGSFDLTSGFVLVVVRGPASAAVSVARWLVDRAPDTVLATSVDRALELPAGATVFVPFEVADAAWLNERRPTLARSGFRWILWVDRAEDLEALQTRAQDVWSWRAVFADLGEVETEPAYVSEAVGAASEVTWAVSGVDGEHAVEAEAGFADQLAALRATPERARVRWTGVFDLFGVWRARWAHAIVTGRLAVLPHEPRVPGVVRVEPPLRYADACRRLAALRGDVAIELELDPQRITAWAAGPDGAPDRVRAGVRASPSLAWTAAALRVGALDLPLHSASPWQDAAAAHLRAPGLPPRFSVDEEDPSWPWRAAEALTRGQFALAASAMADLGDLDAAVTTLSEHADDPDRDLFGAVVWAQLDRARAVDHHRRLTEGSVEYRFAAAFLENAVRPGAAEELLRALAVETTAFAVSTDTRRVAAHDPDRRDLVLRRNVAAFGAGTLPDVAATAILLRSDDAVGLARDHHLGLRPSGDAAAAMGEVSQLVGDLVGSARWAEEAIRREDRVRPGVFSIVRTMAGLRLADHRVAVGDLDGAREALDVARPSSDSDADDWRWLVEVAEVELPGGRGRVTVDLVERGLKLAATEPSIAARAFHLATRLHLETPGGDPTLARRVVDVGLQVGATDVYVAGVVVRAIEWLAEAGDLSVPRAADVVAMTERFDDAELQARALVVLASVDPSHATELVERAARLHPTHSTRLNLAIVLSPRSPVEARSLAISLEGEAAREGRWSDAAHAAFVAACSGADRPEDDLRRTLSHVRRADHATVFAPQHQSVWVRLLRSIAVRDAAQATWLRSALFDAIPADARESWIEVLRPAKP